MGKHHLYTVRKALRKSKGLCGVVSTHASHLCDLHIIKVEVFDHENMVTTPSTNPNSGSHHFLRTGNQCMSIRGWGGGIVKCPGVTHTRNTTAILLNMDSYSQNCLHECKMGRGLFYSTLLLRIQSCCIPMGQNTAHVLSTWIKLFTSLVQKHTAASVHWEISKKMALDKNVELLVPHSFQG